MPTVTVPSPLSAIHSCEAVYFRFSGNSTASLLASAADPLRVAHAPSVRLPEKLAACCRVFLRRGQPGLLSRAPEPRAVLLPESFAGPYPFGAGLASSLSHARRDGPGESTPPRGAAPTAI